MPTLVGSKGLWDSLNRSRVARLSSTWVPLESPLCSGSTYPTWLGSLPISQLWVKTVKAGHCHMSFGTSADRQALGEGTKPTPLICDTTLLLPVHLSDNVDYLPWVVQWQAWRVTLVVSWQWIDSSVPCRQQPLVDHRKIKGGLNANQLCQLILFAFRAKALFKCSYLLC